MKCPYCETVFYQQSVGFQTTALLSSPEFANQCQLVYGNCPACRNLIVVLEMMKMENSNLTQASEMTIYPKFSVRSIEPEVPPEYWQDFTEAASILSLSPKASAALSRRILQQVLREHFNLSRPNLAQEISDFVKLKDVPSYLSEAVEAVRIVGNLAAHPLKDASAGTIVDVEPGEAEWLLEVLESLFDFAFVQPARLSNRKAALNQKLNALGKPPMK